MGIQISHKWVKMLLKGLILAIAVAGLPACGKKGAKGGNGDQYGAGDNVRFYGSDLSPEQERHLLSKNTYYFGYDRYDLSEEDTMSLYAHAKKMMNKPNSVVRIEGHTDERGSREYNVALGDRRAKTISNILMMKGVPANQINVVSYGKEKPSAYGHDESSWSQNRRGMIVYEAE